MLQTEANRGLFAAQPGLDVTPTLPRCLNREMSLILPNRAQAIFGQAVQRRGAMNAEFRMGCFVWFSLCSSRLCVEIGRPDIVCRPSIQYVAGYSLLGSGFKVQSS